MDSSSVGLYVHVPFCERICPYCDFAVVQDRSRPLAQERRYVDAVLRELELRAPLYGTRELASVYFGGGTPSLLSPSEIERIAQAAQARFAPAAELEVTLEVNPSTLERERLPAFRDSGINRLSVGVQSFDDRVLQRLGRAHRAEEAHRTLAAARAAGFGNISLDLMFGTPEQSLKEFESDLDAVVAFGPEHVSTYELVVEAGTPFELAAERGQLAIPEEDAVAAMIERLDEQFAGAGFERYEITNHCRPGYEAVHNSRYWTRAPVLGIGVGAFSSEPSRPDAPYGARRANTRSLPRYFERVAAGRSAGDDLEVFDSATARGEAVFLALRGRAGLEAATFEHEFGESPRNFYRAEIETLVDAGLLVESPGGDLRLTNRGRMLADSVSAHFVEESAGRGDATSGTVD